MGKIAYRGNLSSSIYPMTVADGGRTVIIPGPDQNFDRRVDPTGEQKDAGIPQALYLENVMPTVSGYQSVGFLAPTVAMAAPSGSTSIVKEFESWSTPITITGTPARWQSGVVTKIPLFFWNNGKVSAGVYGDVTVNVFDGAGVATTFTYNADPLFNLFSTANVRGVCYLFHNQKLYTVEHAFDNAVAPVVVIRDVTGTVLPAGICAFKVAIVGSNNYLILTDTTTIYWSSTTTPTDFTSSLVSGAGQIDPNNSDGAIWYLTDTRDGFYIHSNNNTLLARYTGNSRYPWKFVALKGGLGLSYPLEQLMFSTVDSLYAVVFETDKQIKFYSEATGESFFPELNNYLKQTVRAELDYNTNVFTEQYIRTDLAAVKIYCNRFLIISVDNLVGSSPSISQYTAAIIFDIQTRRFGRIALAHDYVFEIDKSINTVTGYLEPLLGFLNVQTKTIKYFNFDMYQKQTYTGANYETMQGALLLGKFQYVRARMMQLEQIEIEGPQNTVIVPSPNFSLALLPSTDGRNFDTPISLTASYLSGGVAKYFCHNTAQNHSLLLKGAFSVNTLQLRFVPGGER